MHHVNINVSLVVENAIRSKRGIAINVNVRAKLKKTMRLKNIILGILLHVLLKMVNT